MVTDERLTHYIEHADLVGDNGTPAISTGELASMARELQSLRASIPGGAGVKVISVDEVEKIILENEPSQLSDRGDKIWTRRMATALAERLSALDLSPAEGEPWDEVARNSHLPRQSKPSSTPSDHWETSHD